QPLLIADDHTLRRLDPIAPPVPSLVLQEIRRREHRILCVLIPKIWKGHLSIGGGGEIRTREGCDTPHAFQACALDHSATPPSFQARQHYSVRSPSVNCRNSHSSSSGLRSNFTAMSSIALTLSMPGCSFNNR